MLFWENQKKNVYRSLAHGAKSNLNYFNLNKALHSFLPFYLHLPASYKSQVGGVVLGIRGACLQYSKGLLWFVLRCGRINSDVILCPLRNSGASAKSSSEHDDGCAVPSAAEQRAPGEARGSLQP